MAEHKGPIGIIGEVQWPRLTETEYNELLAKMLAVGTIETVELCDCDTWDCDCDG